MQVKIIDLAAKRTFNGDNRIGLREEIEPVLQKFEIGSNIAPDNIGSRGQKLAELHIGRTKLVHGPRHALGTLHVTRARTRQNARNPVSERRKAGKPLDGKRADDTLARQYPSGPHQPESGGKITHMLKFPAGMKRGNTAGKIAITHALETSLLDHRGKILLLGNLRIDSTR